MDEARPGPVGLRVPDLAFVEREVAELGRLEDALTHEALGPALADGRRAGRQPLADQRREGGEVERCGHGAVPGAGVRAALAPEIAAARNS